MDSQSSYTGNFAPVEETIICRICSGNASWRYQEPCQCPTYIHLQCYEKYIKDLYHTQYQSQETGHYKLLTKNGNSNSNWQVECPKCRQYTKLKLSIKKRCFDLQNLLHVLLIAIIFIAYISFVHYISSQQQSQQQKQQQSISIVMILFYTFLILVAYTAYFYELCKSKTKLRKVKLVSEPILKTKQVRALAWQLPQTISLQERLDEQKICTVCCSQAQSSTQNLYLRPCQCSINTPYIHRKCLEEKIKDTYNEQYLGQQKSIWAYLMKDSDGVWSLKCKQCEKFIQFRLKFKYRAKCSVLLCLKIILFLFNFFVILLTIYSKDFSVFLPIQILLLFELVDLKHIKKVIKSIEFTPKLVQEQDIGIP